MTCDYCEGEYIEEIVSSEDGTMRIVNSDVSAYVIGSKLFVEVTEENGGLGLNQMFSGHINYCPMCGRRLAGRCE